MSLTLDHNQSLTIIFRDRNDVDICVNSPAQIHTEQGITTISTDGKLWRYLDKDVLYIMKRIEQ